MTIISAGANVALTAGNPLLKEIVVGFGWNVIKSNGPITELVPSAIMCGDNGKALSDDDLVFFNQMLSPDGSVEYVSDGDSEQIEVALNQIPDTVAKIVFVVYVDPDIRRPGNFGSVRSAYVRVADREKNEIVRYNLEDESGVDVTAMVFGELYRHNGNWKFRAVGQGYSSGLAGVAKDFGVQI